MYVWDRVFFVQDTVVELERSHPDAIARMLLVSHTVFLVNSNGIAISKRMGTVRLIAAALHRSCPRMNRL